MELKCCVLDLSSSREQNIEEQTGEAVVVGNVWVIMLILD